MNRDFYFGFDTFDILRDRDRMVDPCCDNVVGLVFGDLWPEIIFILCFVCCWFSHDVTKIQTKNISILPRFYFHDALEQLKTNFHTNFCFKRVLGFVIEYA